MSLPGIVFERSDRGRILTDALGVRYIVVDISNATNRVAFNNPEDYMLCVLDGGRRKLAVGVLCHHSWAEHPITWDT